MKSNHSYRKTASRFHRRSTTIIEVVVAIVILSVALPSLMMAFADASVQSIGPYRRSIGSYLAIERMSQSIQNNQFVCKSVVLGLIAVVGFACTGCSNFGGDKGVTVTRVEGAGTDPVDAQERQRRFKSAYEYGIKFARQKRYAEALAGFEEAVRLQPNSVPAQFNLAACYEGIGDPLKAIGIYNRILRVQPNDADCYHNLGTSYMKMHHLDRSPQWKKLAVQACRW